MEVPIAARYINEMVSLEFGRYGNHSIAIRGYSDTHEPLFTATVGLDEIPRKGHVFLKGWSENEGIPKALEKAGIVKLTGRTIPTGFSQVQEAELLEQPPK